MHVKKLAFVFATLSLAAFGMAADCSGGAKPCPGGDADCTDATSPVCDDNGPNPSNVCVPPQCNADDECQAGDIGGTKSCGADGDCDTGEKCVNGENATSHCVVEEQATDPPCSDVASNLTEVQGKDTDGSDVVFCGDTGVSCDESPGKCKGGTFN